MINRKKYKLLISNKLPNNSFISVEFGTEIEDDCDPIELMDKVRKAVYEDIKRTREKDPAVKACWESMLVGLAQEKKIKEADKQE